MTTASISRRALLRGAGFAFCSCCLRLPALAQGGAGRRLCATSAEGDVIEEVAPAAYAPWVERYLAWEQERLAGFFETGEARYLVGVDYRYAYAEGNDNRRGGKIVVGDGLIEANRTAPYGWQRTLGVLAHESAHLYQFAHRIDEILIGEDRRVKMIELHADYLAGCYMATWAQATKAAPAEMAQLLFTLGDADKDDPDHHGEPKERYAFFAQGYRDVSIELFRGSAVNPEFVWGRALQGLIWLRKLLPA